MRKPNKKEESTAEAEQQEPDPAYESSFALDSFEGEKFGSVLPGDVVRKKRVQRSRNG